MSTLVLFYVTVAIVQSASICTSKQDCINFSGEISCQSGANCTINCDVSKECTNIICHNNSICDVYCTVNSACWGTIFNATDATKLTITTKSTSAAYNAIVYCPTKPGDGISCILKSEDNFSASQYSGVTIYSIEGFYDVSITCNANGCATPGGITLWCGYDLKSKCPIDISSAGKYNKCQSTADDFCEHPPTFQPISFKPTTSLPTTSNPTTLQPTTMQPTTKSPTTAIPTTKHPTTSKPTTLHPTTATPTSAPTHSPTLSPTFSPTTHATESVNVDIQYVILSCLMVVTIAYILIKSCSKLYSTRNSEINITVRTLAISQMVLFLLCYFFWIIDIFLHHEIVFNVLQYVMFALGWIVLYLFMVHRLYYTFSDSIYSMTRFHLYFHVFIIIFIPIWYASISVLDEMRYSMSAKTYFILSVIGLIIIFIGLLTLIISFNRNLFYCYIINETKKHSMDIRANNGQLTAIQISVLSVITKHSLLGSIAVMVELLFVIAVCLLTFLSQSRNDISWIVYEWCLGLLIIINLISVYFGFKANEKEYERFCGKPHSKLFDCCEHLAYKYIRRKKATSDSIDNIYFAQMDDDSDL